MTSNSTTGMLLSWHREKPWIWRPAFLNAFPSVDLAMLAQRYKKMHGKIEVLLKPSCNHHPHSLGAPAPIVRFILDHEKYATLTHHPRHPPELDSGSRPSII